MTAADHWRTRITDLEKLQREVRHQLYADRFPDGTWRVAGGTRVEIERFEVIAAACAATASLGGNPLIAWFNELTKTAHYRAQTSVRPPAMSLDENDIAIPDVLSASILACQRFEGGALAQPETQFRGKPTNESPSSLPHLAKWMNDLIQNRPISLNRIYELGGPPSASTKKICLGRPVSDMVLVKLSELTLTGDEHDTLLQALKADGRTVPAKLRPK